jgi:hypothetical protein
VRPARSQTRARGAALRRWWPLAAALLALGPARAGALEGPEIRWRGLLDVVLAERGKAYDLNLLTRGDASFDAYGMRLFADGQVGERLQLFGQIVLRDQSGLYVEGAYATFTPDPERDLHLLAGKLPWAIGTYAPRSYSNRNPLVGTPLMYQYHSTLVWYAIPSDADALLAEAGSGQHGIGYAYGGFGMPVVDDSYWDVGVTVTGSQRPLEYAAGMVMGTPGWGVTSQDDNGGKSFLGRVGLAPTPSLRVGVSASYGPYLQDALNPSLPAGKTATDYHQRLGMADLEVLAGHLEVRGEGAWNVWETPTVGDLEVASGYAEAKYSFSFGGYVAGRFDAIRFGKIRDSSGAERPWDADLTRFEAGVGYRFDRNVIAKLVYQHNELEFTGPSAHHDRPSLVAAQLSISF